MRYTPPTLTGRDVVLRPLTVEDVDALAKAAAESRETYLFNPVPNGVGQTREYVAKALRQFEEGQRMPFAISYLGRIVGTTSYGKLETWSWPPGSPLQRESNPDVVEIGYTWLAQSAQRTRCNTEAKFLLLAHAFEVWQIHRASFRTDERNARSRSAIERLGAKFEGIRRADMPSVDGSVRNSAYYSIVLSEWSEIRESLVRRLEVA